MLAHPGICPLVPLQHLHYNGYKDGGALSHFLHNSEHELRHSTYEKFMYTQLNSKKNPQMNEAHLPPPSSS